jgi:type I restriction enzyme S subunit
MDSAAALFIFNCELSIASDHPGAAMKNGWGKRRLRDVTTKIGSGATPLGGEAAYQSEGISLIRSLNVHDAGFRTKDLAFIDESQAAQLDNVVVEAGDVLLNITGASVARCCVVPDEMLPARVNQHVSILRPKKNELLPKLLHYMLISKDYKDRLLNAGEGGGSTRQALTKSQLQEFWIEIPEELSEQRRIVGILDEAFEGIATAKANAEQNLQNARALFESHLQAVFTQRGDGWVEKPLETVAAILNGYAFKSSDFSPKAGVKCIKITNVGVREFVCETDSYLPDSFASIYDAVSVKNGSIVLALTRTIIAGGLKVAVVPEEFDGSLLNQRVASIIANHKHLNAAFLFAYLSTQTVVDYVKERVNTLMQPNLSITDLRLMPIPVPSVWEQNQITEQLNSLREETQRLESLYQRKLAALDELKKSLLHRAFSGQL